MLVLLYHKFATSGLCVSAKWLGDPARRMEYSGQPRLALNHGLGAPVLVAAGAPVLVAAGVPVLVATGLMLWINI